MNDGDLLSRFRGQVPAEVTPRAEQLFLAAIQQEQHSGHPAVPRPRRPLLRVPRIRLGIAALAVAGLAAGVVTAVQPTVPAPLTATLLADRASAAALAQPALNPGQWVYREFIASNTGAKGSHTQQWETADGTASIGSAPITSGVMLSYAEFMKLPDSPAALDAYLESTSNPQHSPDPEAAFMQIAAAFDEYQLPPAREAELYQALAIFPGVQVDSHVTTLTGQVGVAFALKTSPTWHLKSKFADEIILNPSTYAYMGQAMWQTDHAGKVTEFQWDVAQEVLVSGPGSTQPSSTPPTPAELLAEQVDWGAYHLSLKNPLYVLSPFPAALIVNGTWILHQIDTSSGKQTIWATADDSKQASYVDGKLQVCSRSDACAKSPHWLMPAGPAYAASTVPVPSAVPSDVLTQLNAYSTGCTDVAGDCNAVAVIANVATGYAKWGGFQEPNWFLALAEVPGVTVQHLTDVTGQHDVAFRFPFTDGVTEILFNASTHQLVGYVRNGVQTVLTKAAIAPGPGLFPPA